MFLILLVISATAFAADSNLVHCWVFSATVPSDGGIAASLTNKKDSLDKTIDLSNLNARTLLNQDADYHYSASFKNGELTLMSLGEKQSGFYTTTAPNKTLTDKESVVLSLRKPLPEKKTQLAELHCAKEAFFKKWKKTN